MTWFPRQIPNYLQGPPTLVPSFDFLQRYVPEEWHRLGEDGSEWENGFRAFGGGAGDYASYYPEYRRWGDCVQLRGCVDNNGGSFVPNQAIATLPELYRSVEERVDLWVSLATGAGPTYDTVYGTYNTLAGILTFSGGMSGSPLANPMGNIVLDNLLLPLTLDRA